jgi:aldehyde dehydrogenase
MAEDDDFFDKALEGFTMFALNQGEVCTCPSRALVQESIYDQFLERAVARTKKIKPGQPARPDDDDRRAGLASSWRRSSATSTSASRRAPRCSPAASARARGDLAGGYYVQPTVFAGHNKMRIFQEEIFGPVVSVTTFKDFDDALAIANDTLYGLGAGVWTRDGNRAYRAGRAIQAGRVWTNCYHLYPAHAAFGGYKQSGIGRENHKMMLDHYQQTKNLLVSYDPKPMGFF